MGSEAERRGAETGLIYKSSRAVTIDTVVRLRYTGTPGGYKTRFD